MSDAKGVAIISGNQQALAVQDYGDDVGGGFENTTSADFKTPWLKVLDAKSRDIEAGVPGAKAGLIINTITKAIYATTLFVPSVTEAYYVEWKPRAQGGGGGKGFVAAHRPDAPMVVAALAELAKKGGKFAKGPDGKNLTAKHEGNDLIETYYVHGQQIVEETGDVNRAMLAFSSTGIKGYQGWLGLAKDQKTSNKAGERVAKPLYAHVYRLGTVKEEGNGNTWWNFTVRFAGEDGAQSSLIDVTSGLFTTAKDIKKEVLAGNVKVDHSASGDDAEGAGKADIPF